MAWTQPSGDGSFFLANHVIIISSRHWFLLEQTRNRGQHEWMLMTSSVCSETLLSSQRECWYMFWNQSSLKTEQPRRADFVISFQEMLASITTAHEIIVMIRPTFFVLTFSASCSLKSDIHNEARVYSAHAQIWMSFGARPFMGRNGTSASMSVVVIAENMATCVFPFWVSPFFFLSKFVVFRRV